MKKTILYTALLSGILAFATSACMNEDKSKDSEEVAEDRNDAKFDDKKEEDAELLVFAAALNLEEIQLGKLAQINSTNSDVIALGKSLAMEHTNAMSTLKPLALEKRISIPAELTEDGQEAYKKMMNKKGAKFDDEYCEMMIRGHKKAIEKFEKASIAAADSDIRSWASATVPKLKEHLEYSIACQNKLQ